MAWSSNLGGRLELTRKISRLELVLQWVVSRWARVALRVGPLLSVAGRSVWRGCSRWWHHVPGGPNVPWGKTLFPLVVCTPVPMPRASLLLLESDPWPPCPCAAKLDPLAPCWDLPLALLPVELLLFAVVSLVCSCLPWS